MGAPEAGRIALMAIHPRYANAILDGEKTVEFRKRPPAADVTTVVIYATAPVQKIVGEFTVDHILVEPPGQLWSALHMVGGIEQEAFNAYYSHTGMATAIMVSAPRRYARPVGLADLDPAPAVPQSFAYLPLAALQQLHETQGDPRNTVHELTQGLGRLTKRLLPRHGLPLVRSWCRAAEAASVPGSRSTAPK